MTSFEERCEREDEEDRLALARPLLCPDCGEPVWDGPHGHKLAKCWGCGIAFDTMDGCATWEKGTR